MTGYSTIFGDYRSPVPLERDQATRLAQEVPVLLMQVLQDRLKKLGYCLQIEKLE